jgi:uncharacterized repeat protein (TIGR01451 family)
MLDHLFFISTFTYQFSSMKKKLIIFSCIFSSLLPRVISQNFSITANYSSDLNSFYHVMVKHGSFYYTLETNSLLDSTFVYRYDLNGLNKSRLFSRYNTAVDYPSRGTMAITNNHEIVLMALFNPTVNVLDYYTGLYKLDTLGNVLDSAIIDQAWTNWVGGTYLDTSGSLYFPSMRSGSADLLYINRYNIPGEILDSVLIDTAGMIYNSRYIVSGLPGNMISLNIGSIHYTIDSTLNLVSKDVCTGNCDSVTGANSNVFNDAMATEDNRIISLSISDPVDRFYIYDMLTNTSVSFLNNIGPMDNLLYISPNRYLGLLSPAWYPTLPGMWNFYLMDSSFQLVNYKPYYLPGTASVNGMTYHDGKIAISFVPQDTLGQALCHLVLDTSFNYIYSNVKNVIFNDANDNCAHDLPESFITEIRKAKHQISHIDYFGVPFLNDTVYFDIPTGTYDLEIGNPFAYTNICLSNDSIVITGDTVFSSFFGQPDYEIGVMAGLISPFNLPFGTGSMGIFVDNIGLYPLSNAQLVLKFDTNISFSSASLLPSLIASDSLVWNMSGINDTYIDLQFNVPPNLSLSAYLLQFRTYLTGMLPTDTYSQNNADTLECIINNSFDPNDKSTNPVGVTAAHFVRNDQPLEYLIRFQNTGNYAARNIFIIDTLNSNLDKNSFRILNASHPFTASLVNNHLMVSFNDINLMDAGTNEPASHGFIRYEIRPNPDLSEGTVINNRASIFFDLNSPILTNATFNTINYHIGIEEEQDISSLNVYPNPVRDILHLYSSEALQLVEIIDMAGRKLISINLSEISATIDVSCLKPGLYFLQTNDVCRSFIKL